MHIAIEGIDGVGKSSVSKKIAEILGFIYVEKPLHYLFDEGDGLKNYIRIRDFVNKQSDRVFTSWFYGLGNIYTLMRFKGENIITDRHLLSNYSWSGTSESEPVFDLLVQKIGCPDITFILYASPETVLKRISSRDENDNDKSKVQYIPELYNKMELFCIKHKMLYEIIQTDNLSFEEEVALIVRRIEALRK